MIFNKKDIKKSVLRYPGGKSKAMEHIVKYFPQGLSKLVAPFFGGGSIEIACASQGIEVIGYDIFKPLINFWQCSLEDADKLSQMVSKYHPLTKDDFYLLQKKLMNITDKWESACVFYVLNRSSFSGSTLSGGISPNHPRFNQNSIDRLKNFQVDNLTVKEMDFHQSIPLHHDSFLYLDPPYLIKNTLYGNKGDTHRDFDHQGLFELLDKRDNWILSYNNCPEIIKLYENYTQIFPSWKYGMGTDKNSREIIIVSHDIAKELKKQGLI